MPSSEEEGFECAATFEKMTKKLETRPELADKINGTFAFTITSGDRRIHYVVVAKKPEPSVRQAKPDDGKKPDCAITISDADFKKLASGKLSGMAAYMSGKMKIKGDMALAQKLALLLTDDKPKAKL